MSKWVKTIIASAVLATSAAAVAAEEPVLHIYNWSDYIAEDTIANFEKATGIKVVYDLYDSNEVLDAKLLSGNSGFDLVVPSDFYLGRQIAAGIYQPLKKDALSNYGNLDPQLMKIMQSVDKDNAHAVPYMWGTNGIGYNAEKVKAALGENAPVDSWDLVFKPENMEKLAGCGVAFLDSPKEVMATALNYMGKNPNSEDPKDYEAAKEMLLKVRPYIRYFHSSQYINDLANGDICVAVGYSGDILQAADRATEAANGVKVEYRIPKEGAQMWVDSMAIPADAKHPENAHKFINFILQPDVVAGISNYVMYANPNAKATELVDDAVKSNPGIYPSDDVKAKLFMVTPASAKLERVITRAWTTVQTNQ
ncbi:spermidine/putrescine ABC transporter substrate-binding protein [Pokkaliibacter plantistimulans]|uniref:Putrescine-binding periplasmic protein n=2 Tax=Pseudomonadota TaxID=1224 RepID=A0ABX5LW12_9GAMM|nr:MULTISPECIES: polyamine ABC transporter substrate-binding protein [Pokkaliibacter]MDH2436522.1 polyamine ABC transporter substrate-binding protein [Pokkaliibacter sp. MBI-7]PPC77377.1 spermidine/putrescine ABC transporter substrate-binding protein PotF [Pokkaliibacter plantistimulans]PXF30844.1 spermidine/putrescine ABC transporter substrate-binding protein [Pokkaliibacter plantistimulans]